MNFNRSAGELSTEGLTIFIICDTLVHRFLSSFLPPSWMELKPKRLFAQKYLRSILQKKVDCKGDERNYFARWDWQQL